MKNILALILTISITTGCMGQGNLYFGSFTGNGGPGSAPGQNGITNLQGPNIVGTLTNNTTGNAATATTATSATTAGSTTNFSGSLSGDVTGTQTATVVNTSHGNPIVTNNMNNVVLGSGSTVTTSTNFTGSLSGDVTGTQGATVVATAGGHTIVTNNSVGVTLGGNITASTATNFSGSLSGQVTGTQSATVVSFVSPTLITNGANLTNTPVTALTNSGANSGQVLTVTGTGAIVPSNSTVNLNFVYTNFASTGTGNTARMAMNTWYTNLTGLPASVLMAFDGTTPYANDGQFNGAIQTIIYDPNAPSGNGLISNTVIIPFFQNSPPNFPGSPSLAQNVSTHEVLLAVGGAIKVIDLDTNATTFDQSATNNWVRGHY